MTLWYDLRVYVSLKDLVEDGGPELVKIWINGREVESAAWMKAWAQKRNLPGPNRFFPPLCLSNKHPPASVKEYVWVLLDSVFTHISVKALFCCFPSGNRSGTSLRLKLESLAQGLCSLEGTRPITHQMLWRWPMPHRTCAWSCPPSLSHSCCLGSLSKWTASSKSSTDVLPWGKLGQDSYSCWDSQTVFCLASPRQGYSAGSLILNYPLLF